MSKTHSWEPVDIGDSGRLAMAWHLQRGIVAMATDRDAAGHALSVVFEGLKAGGHLSSTSARVTPLHLSIRRLREKSLSIEVRASSPANALSAIAHLQRPFVPAGWN